MISIATTPTESLNASRVDIKLTGANEFSMQFQMECFSKRTLTDDDGKSHEVFGMIHSEGLSISGPKWKDWVPGAAASDAEYVAGLALKQLGLEAAPSEE
tara:strand:+ start:494 stop:793 length:300 start_codon:yes stop_codon:yes gene_type:complete